MTPLNVPYKIPIQSLYTVIAPCIDVSKYIMFESRPGNLMYMYCVAC